MEEETPPPQPERPWVRSNRVASNSVPQSPKKEYAGYDFGHARPAANRSTTFEGPVQLQRDSSPIGMQRLARVPSDSLSIRTQKSQLRSVSRLQTDGLDESDTSTFYSNSASSPDRYFNDAGASPATSHGSGPTRNFSTGTLNSMSGKKPPPPPPPSRAKKPPPPPPMKRSVTSTGDARY